MSIQFPLEFEFQANHGFDTFFPASNHEVIKQLQALVTGTGEQQFFLSGNKSLGKSHLLQACCQLAHTEGQHPFYYPFEPKRLPPLSLFEDLETVELVCLDNIDNILGHLDWEQTFLNFLNQQLETNNRLILASGTPLDEIEIKLPDLKNHLHNYLILSLSPLEQDEIIAALIHKARYMGITLTQKAGRFLVTHYASDLPSMWVLLEQLDKATLSAQRKLTIPFLKQLLE
ncbi:MAG: DnaA regulatory inactivator Hda [Methylococcales bacterium]|nr:DnaA regulatory inactivator Hda [Methylococcales bacterium]MCK5924321.1 DnaA regulatory inactivator Hda [Methylococcales bacterium]